MPAAVAVRLTAKQRLALRLLAIGPLDGAGLGLRSEQPVEGTHMIAASLIRRGLATKRVERCAGGRRTVYTITDAGREALR